MRRSEIIVVLTAAALCTGGFVMFLLSLHRAAVR
jgi:hypothetical protein